MYDFGLVILAIGGMFTLAFILPVAILAKLGSLREFVESELGDLHTEVKAIHSQLRKASQGEKEAPPKPVAAPVVKAAEPQPTEPKPVESTPIEPRPVEPILAATLVEEVKPPLSAELPAPKEPESPAPPRQPELAVPHLALDRKPHIPATLEGLATAAKSTPPEEERARPRPPVYIPQPTEYQPSRFEAAAQEALQKIWSWIVVGEEHRPKNVSMEFAVATTWLVRVSVLLLILTAGFFLKYSIDHDYLSPTARVALSLAAGTAMIGVGIRLFGKQYGLIGQGLLGGGFAVLYFSFFAAFHFYELISASIAFGLMIFVTICAVALAVRLNSLLVAVLGLFGGYLTPIMLSTGQANFPALFTYMLLLGAGGLGISLYKNWRLATYLSFVCHNALFFGAMTKYASSDFWTVMPFFTAFFVMFSTMIFVFHLVRNEKATLLEPLALLVNVAVFFGQSYFLMEPLFGYRWMAAISLGLAVYYAIHVYLFLAQKRVDREMSIVFLGMSAFFLIVSVPLLLSHQWITVSWALMGLTLLWIAGKIRSEFLRHVSYLLYALAFGRMFCFDLPGQYGIARVADMAVGDYLLAMLERFATYGASIGSLAGGAWLLGRQEETFESADMPSRLSNNNACNGALAGALTVAFVFLNLEAYRSFGFFFAPMQAPSLTLVWLAFCAAAFYRYYTKQSEGALALTAILSSALVIKFAAFDLVSWNIDVSSYRYFADYSFLEAGMRLLDFGALIGFCAVASVLGGRVEDEENAKTVSRGFGATATALLFVFLTLEVNSFLYQFAPGLRAGGVSILWASFALTSLVVGILRKAKELRYVALILFAVVGLKVFFFDLADLDQFYRIIALAVLGLLGLAGAFVYLKFRKVFIIEDSSESSSD